MKIYFILLIVVLLFSCKPGKNFSTENEKQDTITNQEIATIIDTLASDNFEGRKFGTLGNERAALYIENFMVQNNIQPYFEQYRDSFIVGERIGYNLAGLIEGTDAILKNEYIILSAHYDHIGKISNLKDSVYNGANDNASGVSAVLNIAKLLKLQHSNKRSIIVALFSGEEIGLTGSEHFAEKIKSKSSEMYCCLNIDMIGCVLTNKPGKVYISGFEKSNMGTIINQYTGIEMIENIDNEIIYDVFSLSDNYPVYEKLNIPAHTFCTFDFKNYKHYHRLTDEIQNLNIENTSIIVRNIALAISKISNSEQKDIRIIKN